MRVGRILEVCKVVLRCHTLHACVNGTMFRRMQVGCDGSGPRVRYESSSLCMQIQSPLWLDIVELYLQHNLKVATQKLMLPRP